MIRLLAGLAVAGLVVGCTSQYVLPPSTDAAIVERAAEEPPARWHVPLGAVLVDGMQRIDADRLLVTTRKDEGLAPAHELVLVDVDAGRVLWRRDVRDDETWRLAYGTRDRLAFLVETKQELRFVALDAAAGDEQWTHRVGGTGPSVVPLAEGRVVAFGSIDDSRLRLEARELADGSTVWQRSIDASAGGTLVSTGDDLWVRTSTLGALDPDDGSDLGAIDGLRFEGGEPPAVEVDGTLWFLDAQDRVVPVDLVTREVGDSVQLPRGVEYTGLTTTGRSLIARATEPGGRHLIVAIHPGEDELAWTHSRKDPLVSNFVESDDTIFGATTTRLVALDASSGGRRYEHSVVSTGRAFPPRVRIAGDTAVYIGELVAAGFDATTGAQRWRESFEPLSPEVHLDGLDTSIQGLEQALAVEPATRIGSRGSDLAGAEARRLQRLADEQWKRSRTERGRALRATSEGDAFDASLSSWSAANRARMSSSMAKMQSAVGVSLAIVELGQELERAIEQRQLQTRLARQRVFRTSILAAHGAADSDEFVFRPHLDYGGPDRQFVSLALVRLSDGARAETALSPSYRSYGLWNVVDPERGVVYTQGIGMDPSRYRLVNASSSMDMVQLRSIETFLIAAVLRTP